MTEAVRQGARRQLGRYLRLPFYAQMFRDAVFPEAQEGKLSDRTINAQVMQGNAEEVKQRLRQRPSFGASEPLAMPILPLGDDQALSRTLATLGELAGE